MSQPDTPNVDQSEIAKFEALAAHWWDPHGEFRPLHEINPLRVGYIDQRTTLEGSRVLDVGCGGGILAEALAARGADVTAIDAAGAALSVARLHLHETGLSVEYVESTAEEFAAKEPRGFDIITCLEMMEHVPDPASVVDACAKLVRPNGHVFFSTINRTPKSFLFAIVGAEYVLRLLPRGTHEYAKFIRPSELDAWSRNSNLSLEDMTGMHYQPLTGEYRLGPGVDVNYLAYYRKDG